MINWINMVYGSDVLSAGQAKAYEVVFRKPTSSLWGLAAYDRL